MNLSGTAETTMTILLWKRGSIIVAVSLHDNAAHGSTTFIIRIVLLRTKIVPLLLLNM